MRRKASADGPSSGGGVPHGAERHAGAPSPSFLRELAFVLLTFGVGGYVLTAGLFTF